MTKYLRTDPGACSVETRKVLDIDGHVSCQDLSFPKGFGMRNKPQPRICSVCYRLKGCIAGRD